MREKEKYGYQTPFSPQRRCSWPEVQKRRPKKPLWSRDIEAEYPLSNETDEETGGRRKPPFPKDDLGEECMMLAITESHHVQTPEDWPWFRLACHRRGQPIRVTFRVLEALTLSKGLKARIKVGRTLRRILCEASSDILPFGLDNLPVNEEMFNIAAAKRNDLLLQLLRHALARRAEVDKGMRMSTRAEKNLGGWDEDSLHSSIVSY